MKFIKAITNIETELIVDTYDLDLIQAKIIEAFKHMLDNNPEILMGHTEIKEVLAGTLTAEDK